MEPDFQLLSWEQHLPRRICVAINTFAEFVSSSAACSGANKLTRRTQSRFCRPLHVYFASADTVHSTVNEAGWLWVITAGTIQLWKAFTAELCARRTCTIAIVWSLLLCVPTWKICDCDWEFISVLILKIVAHVIRGCRFFFLLA